jgi:uncharacterized membrane protein YedE/YeeE
MTQGEPLAAWRLFELNWIPLGAMAVALTAAVACTDFSLGITGLLLCLGFVGLYAGVAYYNAKAPHRRDPQVVFVLGGIAQIVLVTVLMTPLTYVAATADFPLQDALSSPSIGRSGSTASPSRHSSTRARSWPRG